MNTETFPTEIKLAPVPHDMIPNASRAVEMANAMVVDDQTSYELAANERRDLKRRIAGVETLRKMIVEPLNAHVKRINDLFRSPRGNLEHADGIVEKKMIDFRNAEELKRDEERRRQEKIAAEARAEAERKARAEREKADAEAKRQQEAQMRAAREAEEAAARSRAAREAEEKARREHDAEAEKKARADAETADKERKAREADERRARERAQAALEVGEDKAQATLAAAAAVPTTAGVERAVPSAAGTSVKEYWDIEFVDLKALALAIGEGRAPVTLITGNAKEGRRLAQALKTEMKYDGVRPVMTRGMSVSRG